MSLSVGTAPPVTPLQPSPGPSVTAAPTPSLPNLDNGDDDEGDASETSTPGGSASASASSITSSTSATAPATIGTASQSQSLPAGGIVGILAAILLILLLAVFFLRHYFVKQRAAKITPARSRLSRLVISGPSNFQHLASGNQGDGDSGGNALGNGNANANAGLTAEMWSSRGSSANASGPVVGQALAHAHAHASTGAYSGAVSDGPGSPGWNPSSSFAPSMQSAGENVWPADRDRVKQKYAVDFASMESGLNDHVETMRGNRKAPPRF